MALKVAIACALLALCLARPDAPAPTYFYGAPEESSEESAEVKAASVESVEDYGPAKYDFTYAVKDDDSGNDFGHQEARDGDRTDGSYYVQLPDGRLQKVVYYVDGDSGYVAEVTYEGEAHYPEPESVEVDSVETEEPETESSEETYVYAAPPPPPPSPPKSLYGTPN
ncbi:uncharacterized protein LOC143037090 [Oratosquilla oratoria]|uniref:uncharacterized protein LOC143037090 n=1 Tax=Oratosquilla oratoria TaxID=337810 RepID=UPI003F771644